MMLLITNGCLSGHDCERCFEGFQSAWRMEIKQAICFKASSPHHDSLWFSISLNVPVEMNSSSECSQSLLNSKVLSSWMPEPWSLKLSLETSVLSEALIHHFRNVDLLSSLFRIQINVTVFFLSRWEWISIFKGNYLWVIMWLRRNLVPVKLTWIHKEDPS